MTPRVGDLAPAGMKPQDPGLASTDPRSPQRRSSSESECGSRPAPRRSQTQSPRGLALSSRCAAPRVQRTSLSSRRRPTSGLAVVACGGAPPNGGPSGQSFQAPGSDSGTDQRSWAAFQGPCVSQQHQGRGGQEAEVAFVSACPAGSPWVFSGSGQLLPAYNLLKFTLLKKTTRLTKITTKQK